MILLRERNIKIYIYEWLYVGVFLIIVIFLRLEVVLLFVIILLGFLNSFLYVIYFYFWMERFCVFCIWIVYSDLFKVWI